MSAIYKRELRASFSSMISYIFLAAFVLAESVLFYILYSNGSTSVYAIPFSYPLYMTVFLLPLLTMRSISEDRRLKVDQVLLTAPVKVSAIVLGKFFSYVTIYALAFLPTLIFQIIVSYYQSLNWLIYLYAMLGTVLFGAVLISIGIFISSLTESTVISAILTIVVNLVIMFIADLAGMIGVSWLTKASEKIALFQVYSNFSTGVFRITDIVYFLSITALFLYLSVRSMEKRRWA